MPKTDLSDWIPKQDAARLLGVAEKTLERWADRGDLQKATRKRPGLPPQVVYHPAELERMREAREPAAFVVPHDNGSNGSNGNGETSTAVATVPPARFNPEILMKMLAETFQRQEHVSKLFLTVKESAEYSGLPQTTLRQLMDAGKLEFMKTGAGYRVRKADLERL